MRRIAFIGCSAAKSSGDSRSADERYCSQLFNARKVYCEQQAIEWYVLSAKFGLLKQNEMVREYDESLSSKNYLDFLAWHIAVVSQFVDFLDDEACPALINVELHAGELYCKPLESILIASGFNVSRPVRSLAIGKQLQFYSNAAKERATLCH